MVKVIAFILLLLAVLLIMMDIDYSFDDDPETSASDMHTTIEFLCLGFGGIVLALSKIIDLLKWMKEYEKEKDN